MSGPRRLSAISKALMVTCRSFTRADGPPHDEPRAQIQDRRELQFAAAADDELGRVADPPLIRGVRLELAVEQIRRDRLVVIAHGGYFVTLPGPCDQAFFLHQPDRPALRLTCSSCSIRSS